MNQSELLDRLDAVPKGSVFVYKSEDSLRIRRGAADLCARAAVEIRRLQNELDELKASRLSAVAVGKIVHDELNGQI
jgi:hypothetical protein